MSRVGTFATFDLEVATPDDSIKQEQDSWKRTRANPPRIPKQSSERNPSPKTKDGTIQPYQKNFRKQLRTNRGKTRVRSVIAARENAAAEQAKSAESR